MKLEASREVRNLGSAKKWVCNPPVPFFCRDASLRPVFTILRREGTCAAVDAPDEVPTAMDAVLVEVFPRRTCFRFATEYAEQCSWPFSTSRRA